MVGMFGATMTVHSSPKDLGLMGLFSDSPDWIYGLFWAVLRLIVGLLIDPCVLFLVLLLKMNNMLIVCKLC